MLYVRSIRRFKKKKKGFIFACRKEAYLQQRPVYIFAEELGFELFTMPKELINSCCRQPQMQNIMQMKKNIIQFGLFYVKASAFTKPSSHQIAKPFFPIKSSVNSIRVHQFIEIAFFLIFSCEYFCQQKCFSLVNKCLLQNTRTNRTQL